MTAQDVLKMVQDEGVEIVDMRFTDLPGLQQHFSISPRDLTEESFEEGLGFDGSSIRGFQEIQESDMLVKPDPRTAFIDPFRQHKTLVLICDVADPVTLQNYSRDPRYIAQKAVQYMQSTGIADESYWGPEAEFFILNSVRFGNDPHRAFYELGSREGIWESGEEIPEGNLGYRPRHKEGYFPVPPTDSFQDLRSEMMLNLEKCGIQVEVHHHEVATAGQAEIDLRFGRLVETADNLMAYKYIVKNTARQHGFTVTFMPKPIFSDNGTGMHTHQSLWKDGKNLFYDPDGYAGLSQTALYYIGGLLKHAPALLAFAAPTTNSYKRLVPGYEAPILVAYSQRNRSAAVRIPMYSKSEKAKRIEFRPPDPSCNPYLTFSALLMAGLDGIRNQIDPGDPMDRNLYDLPPEEMASVDTLPTSLLDVLAALEADHEFLLAGEVFTPDVLEKYITYKREEEYYAVNNRPHPYEFFLYFDI